MSVTQKIHETMGDSLMKKGYPSLLCEKCKAERRMESGEAGRYMATGWPMCCGQTMTLRSANDNR